MRDDIIEDAESPSNKGLGVGFMRIIVSELKQEPNIEQVTGGVLHEDVVQLLDELKRYFLLSQQLMGHAHPLKTFAVALLRLHHAEH